MLGTDGRLYDPYFDFDNDGRLDGFEREMYDDSFTDDPDAEEDDDIDYDAEEMSELREELENAGLDPDDFATMSRSEIREALEDAGLDPDDYDMDELKDLDEYDDF